jgi:hypothetical protein
MATIALYTFEDIYLTLSGSNITAVSDQAAVGPYNLAELTSGNGGTRELTGFGGYPCVLQDGTDDALIQTGGLPNAMVGGTDNSCWVGAVQSQVATGTGGDAVCACGNSGSANFFFRFVEGTATVTETRKRDDATAAGAGAGATGTAFTAGARQYWEWSHASGQNTELLRTGTTGGLTTYITSTAMDVGACTSNRFALGCLYRVTAASFMNQRVAMLHICDAPPTSGELISLRSLAAKYISAPQILNSPADRIRRDRHIHAMHRPTTWKLSKNGVMIPAEDRRIVQVNGFRRAA